MTQTIQFTNDLFLHDSGASTPTLNITHLVFSCKASLPNENDTLITDNREFERIALTLTHSLKKTSVTCEVTPSLAVCPTYTISSIALLNQLTLASVTALEIGDLVDVEEIGGYKDNEIINIVGLVVTLKNNVSLNLATTKLLRRKIARYAVVYDGTSTRLSGKVRKWFALSKFKDTSTNTYPFNWSFDTRG